MTGCGPATHAGFKRSIARTAATVIAPSISALTRKSPSEAHSTPPGIGTPEIRSCPSARHALVITLSAPAAKIAPERDCVTPQAVRKISGGDSRQRHVEDVRAQREHASILKDERLQNQDRGQHQRSRGRSQDDGQQGAADQVSAGARTHREIDHLRREDERSHHAQQRNPVILRIALGAPRHPGDGRER